MWHIFIFWRNNLFNFLVKTKHCFTETFNWYINCYSRKFTTRIFRQEIKYIKLNQVFKLINPTWIRLNNEMCKMFTCSWTSNDFQWKSLINVNFSIKIHIINLISIFFTVNNSYNWINCSDSMIIHSSDWK